MQINFYNLKDISEDEKSKILRRAEFDIESLKEMIMPVVQDVKEHGDSALIKYTEKFDGALLNKDRLRVSDGEFEKANAGLDSSVREVIERSAQNIRKFHEKQMPEEMWFTEIESGVMAGEKITPLDSLGIYVPRGKGSFPSVLLMLSIPARLAGVKRIIICTPPQKDGSIDDASLVAAQVCGITEVYKVGGAQSIAAMAFGTESLPRVDKITGPGSSYVSSAKRLLRDYVDVGLPAGPSESIILADEKCDPHIAAIDLLVEAEHGPDSAALLVTHSMEVANRVKEKLPELIKELPPERQDFCKKGFSSYGGIVVTGSLTDSIAFTNDYAPEHLELLVDDPMSILNKIKHAGEILLGKYTPITISNFTLGINAILPTGGYARTCSSVTVHDFLKRTSIGYLTKEGYDRLKLVSQKFAEYEGFPAHANAIKNRRL